MCQNECQKQCLNLIKTLFKIRKYLKECLKKLCNYKALQCLRKCLISVLINHHFLDIQWLWMTLNDNIVNDPSLMLLQKKKKKHNTQVVQAVQIQLPIQWSKQQNSRLR